MLRMEALTWKTCSIVLGSVICALLLQDVTCQEETTAKVITDLIVEIAPAVKGEHVRGDDIPPTPADNTQAPEQDQSTQASDSSTLADHQVTPAKQDTTNQPAAEASQTHLVMCVDEAAVRNKVAVKLKLKTSSSCEENKAKIQSVLEHLCGDGSKLEIYQQDGTAEMILSGQCIEADAKKMTEKLNNDNIKDKVGVVEAVPVLVKHSRTVLMSVLIAGLLLAALLIVAYLLKTRRSQSKGVRLAEESFQVDEQNQGNTLLSVAPLPPQEPLDKPTSNGENQESPPTNGHSATQSPVADSQM